MRRPPVVLVLLAAGAACTEEITVPGVCPDYCPPARLTSVYTVLLDAVERDSAFRGYARAESAGVMLVADVPGADARAVFRTRSVPSTTTIGSDTAVRVVGVDSVQLRLLIARREGTWQWRPLRNPPRVHAVTRFDAPCAGFVATGISAGKWMRVALQGPGKAAQEERDAANRGPACARGVESCSVDTHSPVIGPRGPLEQRVEPDQKTRIDPLLKAVARGGYSPCRVENGEP